MNLSIVEHLERSLCDKCLAHQARPKGLGSVRKLPAESFTRRCMRLMTRAGVMRRSNEPTLPRV